MALRRGDLQLDGSNPEARVRRSVTKGGRFKPPKSRKGIREVPLSPALVSELPRHLASLPPGSPDDLAFPSKAGTLLQYPNMLRRVLRPAAEEAGAAWAGFHTFRHTYASLMIAAGVNIVTLSELMGHGDPAFTLRVYAHLIPGDEKPSLDLDQELQVGTILGPPVASRPVPLSPVNGHSEHDFGLNGTPPELAGSVAAES
jgi:integrase